WLDQAATCVASSACVGDRGGGHSTPGARSANWLCAACTSPRMRALVFIDSFPPLKPIPKSTECDSGRTAGPSAFEVGPDRKWWLLCRKDKRPHLSIRGPSAFGRRE